MRHFEQNALCQHMPDYQPLLRKFHNMYGYIAMYKIVSSTKRKYPLRLTLFYAQYER